MMMTILPVAIVLPMTGLQAPWRMMMTTQSRWVGAQTRLRLCEAKMRRVAQSVPCPSCSKCSKQLVHCHRCELLLQCVQQPLALVKEAVGAQRQSVGAPQQQHRGLPRTRPSKVPPQR